MRSPVPGASSLFTNMLQAVCWWVMKYDRKLKLNGPHKIKGQRALCDVEGSSLIASGHLFGRSEDFKELGKPTTRNRR